MIRYNYVWRKTLSILFGLLMIYFLNMSFSYVIGDWQNLGLEGFYNGEARNLDFVIDEDGISFVAFEGIKGKGRKKSNNIMIMKLVGDNWENLGSNLGDFKKSYQPSIDVDPEGIPYVAFIDGNGSKSSLSVIKYNGNTREYVGSKGFIKSRILSLHLQIDLKGNVFVSYEEQNNRGKISVSKFDGKKWTNIGKKGFTPGNASWHDFHIDQKGGLYISYSNKDNDGKAVVMKFDGKEWIKLGGNKSESRGYARHTNLASDSQGNIYLSYGDGAYMNKATVAKFDGTTWNYLGGRAGFSDEKAYGSNLVINKSDEIYLSYTDSFTRGNTIIQKYNGEERQYVFKKSDSSNIAISNTYLPISDLDGQCNMSIGYIDTISNQATVKILSDCVKVPDSFNKEAIEDEFIKQGYIKGGESKKKRNPNSLVGKKKINLSESKGKLLVPVIIKSEDNKIEVEFPEGTVLKSNGQIFEGTLEKPKQKTDNIDNIPNVVASVSIPTINADSVEIKDEFNQNKKAIIRMPTPGRSDGELVNILYSEDNGNTWLEHNSSSVEIIQGEPYVEFETTHFTDFAVTTQHGAFSGSFVINNNDSSTTGQSVLLNMTTSPIASQMRFANDSPSSWSAWEAYSNTKSWVLSAGTGTKTVYVQFDQDGDNTSDAETQDFINYTDGSVNNESTSMITLKITAGDIQCSHTGWDMGSTKGSVTDVTIGPVASTQPYSCTDLKGSTNNAMTVTINTELTNGIDTIPAANVTIATGTLIEDCNHPVHSAGGTLDGVISLMTKSNAADICTYSMNPELSVTIPARSSLGIYNGTLQIVYPS